jgi:hypothetical protein
LRTGDLEDHQPPPRPQHPARLGQPALEVGQVPCTESDRHRVEAPVAVGELERVRPSELHGQLLDAALPARQLEHRLGEVATDDAAVGPDPPPQGQRQVARATADVEYVGPGSDLGAIDRPLSPLVVEPGGHGRVHQVIDAGDPIEHPPDLTRELLGVALRDLARFGVLGDGH